VPPSALAPPQRLPSFNLRAKLGRSLQQALSSKQLAASPENHRLPLPTALQTGCRCLDGVSPSLFTSSVASLPSSPSPHSSFCRNSDNFQCITVNLDGFQTAPGGTVLPSPLTSAEADGGSEPPLPSPSFLFDASSSQSALSRVIALIDSQTVSAFKYLPSLNPNEDQRMLTLQVMQLNAPRPFALSLYHTALLSARSCCAQETPSLTARSKRKYSSATPSFCFLYRAASHYIFFRKSRAAQALCARELCASLLVAIGLGRVPCCSTICSRKCCLVSVCA
jgi:hypothetical protein